MPQFITQRALYEARERPSKTYSWQAFVLSNITAEIPWNALMAVLIFVCWYYPVGLHRNAEPTDAVTSRSGLVFLFVLGFLLFASTFTDLVIAGVDSAETGGNITNVTFVLLLLFCGYVEISHILIIQGPLMFFHYSILAQPDEFARFWIFMYRVSPFTYMVSGLLSTSLANNVARCSPIEISTIQPPNGTTCGDYMASYIAAVGDGIVFNPTASADCQFCSITSTNSFLATIGVNFDNRWRDYGILWGFIVFNVFGALFFYWLARVPKGSRAKQA